jgi:hypothetical protein
MTLPRFPPAETDHEQLQRRRDDSVRALLALLTADDADGKDFTLTVNRYVVKQRCHPIRATALARPYTHTIHTKNTLHNKHTHTHTHHTQREKEREKERGSHRERHREKDTDRDRQTERERERERERETEGDRER